MTDRFETPQKVLPAESCPTTKSTPAVRRYENLANESEDAWAETKTQAQAGPAEETAALTRLPTQFGRYRLIRELGRGGMGAVVLAEDTQLARLVALKIPFLKKSSGLRTLKRFQREAKAAASLSHPNLCPVYDFGTVGKHHFLSMAYIEGKPLQAFLDSKTPIPQRTAAGLVKKIAQALQHAHDRGVIHRDLKPSNIMIEPKLGPIVTDFGLARCVEDESDAPLTQDGVAIGTPSYMSPEQLDGDSSQIAPQSDIFSLGLILYEMLTGERRFQGKITRIIGQILTKDPTPLREIREDVDPDLDMICQKMMARCPAERYASMAEVADILRAYLKGELSTREHQNALVEITSDAEGFFLGLSPENETPSSAVSTKSGAAFIRTREELIPPLVISEEDSHSSRILHRAKTKRPKLSLLVIMASILAVGLAWALHRRVDAETPAESMASPALPLAEAAVVEPADPDPAEETQAHPQTAESPDTSSHSAEIPTTQAKWQVEEMTPEDLEPALPDPKAAVTTPGSIGPAVEPQNPTPSESEILKLTLAQGKLDFRITVSKTINESPTRKKYATPRSAISELSQLERRQRENDKSLQELRIVCVLNANAFGFQQAKTARELVAALEEAIRQNISIEEILAKLESRNPELFDQPPISLSTEELARINREIQNLYAAKWQQLHAHLIFGRVLHPQDEIDKAQALFEQECQKIQGLPKRYPLPKLRIRIAPLMAGAPPMFHSYVGDAERHKEQSARGQLIKRIASALADGTLVAPPKD